MSDLHVEFGASARAALCDAFASAHHSIEAQFYSVGDSNVIATLNSAAKRGVHVTVYVEGDGGRYKHARDRTPDNTHVRKAFDRYLGLLDDRIHVVAVADPLVLEHAKAAVVDGARAFVSTANPNVTGFDQPGDALVEDRETADVAAILASIRGEPSQSARVVAGPDAESRARIAELLDAPVDVRIASEGLSDPHIVRALLERQHRGMHDEVLVNTKGARRSALLHLLADCDVAVRTFHGKYLHDKYIDAGDRIYVGSANLSRNGLEEAREIGIITTPADFDDGAVSLRSEFNHMWSAAVSLK
jgi:phosphatidylserine/phosphatidylglycerophosphate/cardiolipin synthase-like enzyme